MCRCVAPVWLWPCGCFGCVCVSLSPTWVPGAMLERCWNDAGTMLERCWNDAGAMLERCWNDAGTMLERCWNDAGTMLERGRNEAGTRPERCWNDAGTMLERGWDDAGAMLPPENMDHHGRMVFRVRKWEPFRVCSLETHGLCSPSEEQQNMVAHQTNPSGANQQCSSQKCKALAYMLAEHLH